ncbi:MAG: hypothetical protein LH478_09855 [Chitinophagaceae bacterium]|nr:hypothetical protein [Chitinophagaceae bacterium]
MADIKDFEINTPRTTSSIKTERDAAITDYEVRSLDTMCVNDTVLQHPRWYNFKYSIVGIIFAIVFVKAEVIS